VSYRDYLEEQRKLARAKKEAKEAKEERLRHPRPPRLDPPPAADTPLHLILLAIFLTVTTVVGWWALSLPALKSEQDRPPTVVVQGIPAETAAIGAWLEREVQASNLSWQIVSVRNRAELAAYLNAGGRADLFIIDRDLAEELYEAGMLAPLLRKAETPSFASSFAPLWDERPFTKTLGWAVAAAGDVDYARHLFTVVQQFGEPFSLDN